MINGDGSEVPARSERPADTLSIVKRWGPVFAIVALMGLAFSMGWHKLLSFETIGANYERMGEFVAENIVAAVLLYSAVYVAVVALSLPGALVMTLTGGLLFGWQLGATATVISATIGATIIFLIAKTSFGETLAEKAGPWLGKLRSGFQENALSYLLFLRLVPAFPFFVVNLAPALLGVPLRTFVAGTALGIIPGTVVFSIVGSSLGSVIEAQNVRHQACLAQAGSNAAAGACPYEFDPGALVTPQILVTFALLGVLALIPVVLKSWSKSHATK